MNLDAQEAALGLLSMGHNYLSQPIPSTSSATLNSILTTTASPVIPQKRKQSDIDQPEFSRNHAELLQQQQQPYLRLTHSPPAEPSPRTNGAERNDGDPNDTSTETVDCICGFAVDDGFSIACDECSRWCHSACFGIAPGSVPEKFACWTCKPRSTVEKERAVRLQRDRLAMADGDGKEAKQRRRSSPGLERKQRRGPNAATVTAPVDSAGPGKRKRRPSMTQPPTPTVTQTAPNGVPEEEQVDVDNEPWREYYAHIVHDIIPHDDTRAKLRHQAAHWRGVTAVSSAPQHPVVVPSSSLEAPPPVSVKPLSPQSSLNPFLSQNSNPLVLPPAFSLHTTQAIPSHSLITPFHSCITPSSTYLADPLNAYAHLGMPKPYVHLLGPPLDVALDARIVGNHSRFARWGCKPNAVLRPILCEPGGSKETKDENTLGFGVFATKDMKANEEIILGWEWDDGNAVHLLPALLEASDTFPLVTPLSTNRPHKIQHIKNQMSNILHALSSTFTTCACGALSKDCALTQMAAFVDGHDLGSLLRGREQFNEIDSEDDTTKIDIGPLVGRKRGFRTRERVPYSGGLGGMQMAADEDVLENGKGFVWDGKRPYKEGISPCPPNPTKKGKERALTIDEDTEMVETPTGVEENSESSKQPIDSLTASSPTPLYEPFNNPPTEPRPPDPPDRGGDGEFVVEELEEERLPPKMRKKWMHRELEAQNESPSKVGLGIIIGSQDEHQLMPPPRMPACMDPTTICSTSATFRPVANQVYLSQRSPTRTPSTSTDVPSMTSPPSTSVVSPLSSFAQLSLLSPALNYEISRQPEPPTQDQEAPEMGAQEGSKTDITAAAEVSVAVTSPPSENSSPNRISSAKSDTEDRLAENHEYNDPPSVLDSHVPGFSRTPSMYSRCHDEDDEVDYSPHSPEPSIEDADEPPREVLPQLHPKSSESPEAADFVSRSVPDNVDESRDYPSPRPDDQATSTPPSTPPLPISSLLSLNPTSDPESEQSPKPSFQDLTQPHPPLPKVKLTLKDFALRKKRQREEQALSQTIQASPVTTSPILPPEGEEDARSLPARSSSEMAEEERILEFKKTFQKGHLTRLLASVNASVVANARLEALGQGGCVVIHDQHEGKSSSTRPDGRQVINGAKNVGEDGWAGSPLDNKNSIARDTTTAMLKECANRTITNSDQSLLPFSKPATATPGANGHLRVPLSHTLPNRPPSSLLPPRPNSKTNARDMKQEVIETLVPSLLQRVSGVERSVSPISPDPTPMVNRISQEEEGEIGEMPALLSSRTPFGPTSKREPNHLQQQQPPLSRNGSQFSHSPPIGPRFYLNMPTSPSLRPTPPSTSPIPAPNNTNGNRPNLPTAPRALRQSMLHNRSGSGPPAVSHPPTLSSQNNVPSTFIPRGPSADRDKGDWEQRLYRLPPRRGTGNGRGAPWGR